MTYPSLVILVLPLGMGERTSCKLKSAFLTQEVEILLTEDLQSFISEDEEVDILKKLLRDRNPSAISVVGYCSGAGRAISLVSKSQINVDKLILVAGEFLTGQPEHQTEFSRGMDQVLAMALLSPAHATTVSTSMAQMRERMATKDLWALDNFNPFISGEYLHLYAQAYSNYKNYDYVDLAANILNEVHFVYGREDSVVSSEAGNHLTNYFNVATVWLEDGDHQAIFDPNSEITKRVVAISTEG